MKEIKKIALTISFTASLEEVYMTQDVYENLADAVYYSDMMLENDPNYRKGLDWVKNHIDIADVTEMEINIQEINI